MTVLLENIDPMGHDHRMAWQIIQIIYSHRQLIRSDADIRASLVYHNISNILTRIHRRYIHEIDTVNTFGRSPLTPHVLSMFMVISDEMRKYFAIRVCTGYYRVGHSPLFLYYELLILTLIYKSFKKVHF